MSEWMQEYINWRWQVRAHFPTSNQVRLSNGRDRKKLLKYNDSLLADAELLMRKSKSQGVVRTLQKVAERLNPMSVYLEAGKSVLFDAEAPQILSLAQQAKPTPPALATLFSGYVHDSLAGFDNAVIEYTGYWRYRKAFLGDDRPLNASNEDTEAVRNIA
jgi:hypothetical protein